MSLLRTANLLGALAGAVSDRLREASGPTDSALAALRVIATFDGCSVGMLAQVLDLTPSATVRLVDRLEAEGWAARGPAKDRRAVALSLTPSGQDRARAVLEERCVALGELVGRLSGDQRAQLDAIAETLLASLTATPLRGAQLCRLCDAIACPPEACPVHQRAHALAADPDRAG